MLTPYFSYKTTQTLPRLLQEVLGNNPELDKFYTAPTTLENFSSQMTTKSAQFSIENRIVLADCLHQQYNSLNPNTSTTARIESLKNVTTFYSNYGASTESNGWAVIFYLQNYYSHQFG